MEFNGLMYLEAPSDYHSGFVMNGLYPSPQMIPTIPAKKISIPLPNCTNKSIAKQTDTPQTSSYLW